jgi:hypothetical protein
VAVDWAKNAAIDSVLAHRRNILLRLTQPPNNLRINFEWMLYMHWMALTFTLQSSILEHTACSLQGILKMGTICSVRICTVVETLLQRHIYMCVCVYIYIYIKFIMLWIKITSIIKINHILNQVNYVGLSTTERNQVDVSNKNHYLAVPNAGLLLPRYSMYLKAENIFTCILLNSHHTKKSQVTVVFLK